MHSHKSKASLVTDLNILCECCGKKHDHTYGSGRFCSEECKNKYIGIRVSNSAKCTQNPKIKAHLDKLRAEGKISVRAPYGTWKCGKCCLIFETRNKLKEHMSNVHGIKYGGSAVSKDEKYVCQYCGREFDTSRQLGGHTLNCKNHPNKEKYDKMHKLNGERLSERYTRGEI